MRFCVTNVWAWVTSPDDDDEDEAITGVMSVNPCTGVAIMMALIADDPAKLEAVRPYAEKVAQGGQRLVLKRFTVTEVLETLAAD